MKLPRTTTGKYSIEAVAKALDVLEAFNGSEELPLSEICARVGLNKNRTFRLLHTLAERGYIDRGTERSRYQLGASLFERSAHVRRDLRQLARPYMQKLHDRFNETVNLGMLNHGDVFYLDILETSRPFRMMATVGCRMPAHKTAMGKAMLARLTADQSDSQALALAPKLTPMRREALQRELERACKRGFAIDNEENEPGVACISASILDAAGVPIAAISVSGPAYRILAGKKSLAQAVMAACQEISLNLGFIE